MTDSDTDYLCCRLHEDGPCFRVVPDDLLQVVKHQLRSTCERLVWTLDPDVLSHAECLLCLLVVLSRSFCGCISIVFIIVIILIIICFTLIIHFGCTAMGVDMEYTTAVIFLFYPCSDRKLKPKSVGIFMAGRWHSVTLLSEV